MARRLLLLALLPLVLGALWLYGRAPSGAVLADLAERFHADRAERYAALAAQRAARGEGPAADALDARMDGLLREVKRTTLRGWEVVLIPPGAPRPAPEDFLRAGSHDVVRASDPPRLRGTYEVWVAPRGALARLVHSLSGR